MIVNRGKHRCSCRMFTVTGACRKNLFNVKLSRATREGRHGLHLYSFGSRSASERDISLHEADRALNVLAPSLVELSKLD